MAAIVSVVCAPNPRRRPHFLRPHLRRRKTTTRRTTPIAPVAVPADGVNYWKIVGAALRSSFQRRDAGVAARDPSSVLYSAVPSAARLIYASSAARSFSPPPLSSFSSRLLFRNLSPPPSRSSRFPRAARGMNFVSRAPSFISQTFRPPYALSPIPPSMYRFFRIRVLASRCITALPTSGSPYRAMCILSALIFRRHAGSSPPEGCIPSPSSLASTRL